MPKNTRKQKFEKDETDFPGINKENRLDQEGPEQNTETLTRRKISPRPFESVAKSIEKPREDTPELEEELKKKADKEL